MNIDEHDRFSTCGDKGNGPMSGPKYIITLVHGTFARDSPWTEKDGPLARALRSELGVGEGEVEFLRVVWSGGNSHAERDQAGRELAEHIREVSIRHPTALQYLICHSHGGTVAVNALGLPGIEPLVSGVVTLGTPFITVHRRAIIPALQLLSFAVSTLLAMATLWIGLSISDAMRTSGPLGAFFFLAGIAVTTILMLATWWVARFWQRDSWIPWIEERQNQSYARLAPRPIDHARFLCCSVSRDEAGLWLAALQSFGNSFHVAYGALRFWPMLFIVLAFVTFGVGMMVDARSSPFWLAMSGDMGWYAFESLAAFLLVVPLLIAFPWIVRGHRLGFGGETLFDNLLNRITAHSIPSNVLYVDRADVVLARDVRGLRHGALIADAGVAQSIGQWITNPSRVTRCLWPKTYNGYAISRSAVSLLLAVTVAASVCLTRIPAWRTAAASATLSSTARDRDLALRGHPDYSTPVASSGLHSGLNVANMFSVPRGYGECALTGSVVSNELVSLAVKQPRYIMPYARGERAEEYKNEARYTSLFVRLQPGDYGLYVMKTGVPFTVKTTSALAVSCWNRSSIATPRPKGVP